VAALRLAGLEEKTSVSAIVVISPAWMSGIGAQIKSPRVSQGRIAAEFMPDLRRSPMQVLGNEFDASAC
jgi:hypothetical protein